MNKKIIIRQHTRYCALTLIDSPRGSGPSTVTNVWGVLFLGGNDSSVMKTNQKQTKAGSPQSHVARNSPDWRSGTGPTCQGWARACGPGWRRRRKTIAAATAFAGRGPGAEGTVLPPRTKANQNTAKATTIEDFTIATSDWPRPQQEKKFCRRSCS